MKKISKILLRISGFYYLLMSIGLMLSTLFSLLVDRKYIFAIFDLLGFSNISIDIIKPIFFIMLLSLLILISLITKTIFNSIRDKRHFLLNIFIGFFFLFISIVGHSFFRDRIFIISYVFNISLIIGSMLGLKEKSNNYYDDSRENSKRIDEDEINSISENNIEKEEISKDEKKSKDVENSDTNDFEDKEEKIINHSKDQDEDKLDEKIEKEEINNENEKSEDD